MTKTGADRRNLVGTKRALEAARSSGEAASRPYGPHRPRESESLGPAPGAPRRLVIGFLLVVTGGRTDTLLGGGVVTTPAWHPTGAPTPPVTNSSLSRHPGGSRLARSRPPWPSEESSEDSVLGQSGRRGRHVACAGAHRARASPVARAGRPRRSERWASVGTHLDDLRLWTLGDRPARAPRRPSGRQAVGLNPTGRALQDLRPHSGLRRSSCRCRAVPVRVGPSPRLG